MCNALQRCDEAREAVCGKSCGSQNQALVSNICAPHEAGRKAMNSVVHNQPPCPVTNAAFLTPWLMAPAAGVDAQEQLAGS